MKPIFWLDEYAAMHGNNHQLLKFSFEGNEVVMPFSQNDDIVKSPGIGTFGGLFCSNRIVDWPECFREMMGHLGSSADIMIRFPPSYFREELFKSQFQAVSQDFKSENLIDLNQHVAIGPAPESLISKGNRKKYRQFIELKGTVVLNSKDDFDEIISVLQKSRERHKVALSMSRDQILFALQELPNIYTTYAAKIGKEVVAAAITVQIDATTVYILYWGDKGESWKQLSPTVALFIKIYEEALRRDARIIDLGTSSVDGKVNEGLRRFKNNLGATESERITSKFRV